MFGPLNLVINSTAMFCTAVDIQASRALIPRIRFDTNLVRNMILLESTAVLNLVRRPVRKFRVRRGMRNSFGVLGLISVPVC